MIQSFDEAYKLLKEIDIHIQMIGGFADMIKDRLQELEEFHKTSAPAKFKGSNVIKFPAKKVQHG
jgi:hypothetical protein